MIAAKHQLISSGITKNKWSDEARRKSIEARRRKAKTKYKALEYRRYSPSKSPYRAWVNRWEKKNLPALDPKARGKKRFLRQDRDFANPLVEKLVQLGEKVGLTQRVEKLSGSRGVHSSWVDKRTGFRYDFHPSKGRGIFRTVPGKLVETAPNGTKRELKGPQYNLFKRNCQMADEFLPVYIKKFHKLRQAEHKYGNLATKVQNMLQVINGGPGSGFHGHKGIPGHRGGSLAEGSSAPSGGTRYQPARIPLSESPKTIARRQKVNYTKTSRLADLYSKRANELERSRKSRKKNIDELAEIHGQAAKHHFDAAHQQTLIKGGSEEARIEQQLGRLRKAEYHRTKARQYFSKMSKKESRKGFLKKYGGAFLTGAIGGPPEELVARLGAKARDEAIGYGAEAVKGGYRSVKETKGKARAEMRDTLSKSREQYERASGLKGGAANLVRGKAKGMRRQEIDSLKKARRQFPARLLKEFGQGAGSAVKDRTTAKRDEFLSGENARRQRDQEGLERLYDEFRRLSQREADLGRIFKKPGGGSSKSKKPTQNSSSLLSSITANLETGVRRENLGEKEYLVAPLTMIVPGVLAGNKGPLLYPEEEVSKNPGAWNGMPIVVNHPMKDGKPVEARSPEVLNEYQIGTVFNSKYNGKLVAEGWFDVDRTRKTNIGIYQQLVNNKPIELSTGLYTDNEMSKGVWNGREYHYVARNYRPDHLAILLGSRGACSIQDGCGVLINKKQAQSLADEIRQTLNFTMPQEKFDFGPGGMAKRWAKKKLTKALGGKKGVKGAKTGFKGGLAGTVIGGAAGTAVGGPVGTLVGGSAGAAIGSRVGTAIAKKRFGKVGAKGAEVGSLAGSLAAPMGKASLAFKPKKLAQGAGIGAKLSRGASKTGQFGKQLGVGTASYTAGDMAFRKKKRQAIQNAWTEEARKKSAETRRRKAQGHSGAARTAGIAGGAGLAAYTGARVTARQVDKMIDSEDIKKAAKKTKGVFGNFFKGPEWGVDPITRDKIVQLKKAGAGRRAYEGAKKLGPKALRLLKRMRVR